MSTTTPNLEVILNNLVTALPLVYGIIGVLLFIYAFCLVFTGIIDLALSTGEARFLGARNASPFSGMVKILVGGAIATFTVNGQIVDFVSSFAFGDNTSWALASIDSYQPESKQTEIQYLAMTLIVGLTQIIGLLAIIKGLRIFVQASEGSSNTPASRGLVYIIGGVCCVQIIRIHDFFSVFIGFDFFSLIGLR